ncbi:MAG: hypothetical protein WCP96_19135, partial [Methylococcaceae bacterium]
MSTAHWFPTRSSFSEHSPLVPVSLKMLQHPLAWYRLPSGSSCNQHSPLVPTGSSFSEHRPLVPDRISFQSAPAVGSRQDHHSVSTARWFPSR